MLINVAWMNLTTSSVTCNDIGIRLLKRIINVRRLKAKFLVICSATITKEEIRLKCRYGDTYVAATFAQSVVSVSPCRPRYQRPSLLAFVHRTLNIAERMHNRRSMKNSINICVLINRSRVDRFSGAVAVLFCMSFVSCPVYMTTPNTHRVFRNIAPRSNN